jgi:uncharacterized protein (TIGR00369 family)
MTVVASDHVLRQLGMYDVETPAGADLAMAMPVNERVVNTRGALQGGLIATLADVCAGRAAFIRVGDGIGVPTSDLHLRFLEPVLTGPAVAVARVLRHGRTAIVMQVDVYDSGRDDVLAATATLSFTIVAPRTAPDGTRQD